MTSLFKTIPSIRIVLFNIAICLIVFSISLPLILSFCNLEITNKYYEDYFTLRMMLLGHGSLVVFSAKKLGSLYLLWLLNVKYYLQ